jgi:acylphosphatase
MPTVHLLIKGKVQGVFYRASAKEAADELQITGWVRNTDEGHVEIAATGGDEQLKKFINWCKHGPSHAVVTEILTDKVPDTRFERFKIIKG